MHLDNEQIQALAAGLCAGADVRAHVRVCPQCAQGVASWRALFAAVAVMPGYAPREGFADRVMARVRVPARASRLSWPPHDWVRAAATLYGAATMSLLLILVAFGRELLALAVAAPDVLRAAGARLGLTAGAHVALATERYGPTVVATLSSATSVHGLILLTLLASLVPFSALVLIVQLRTPPSTRLLHATHS